jgi:hypothetical protein
VTDTERERNRATLARQLLLERHPETVPSAVRRIVAIQAQEPASPYLSLWNRIADFDPAELDTAFAEHRVVKSSLFRGTLHAVHAGDRLAFHIAMLPSLRASRLDDRRFTDTRLTAEELDDLLPVLSEFVAEPRTRVEIEAFLDAFLDRHEPRAWWALRMYAPLHHAPTGGPWSFGTTGRFTAAPGHEPMQHAQAVSTVVVRYPEGFGPATLRDIAQFTMLRAPVLLVDGYVAGVWRATGAGIEVTEMHPIDDEAWEQLEAEARALRAFLADREPTVFGRYAHWWASLRGTRTRTLAV